jgi:hypothetical protein
MKEVGSTGVLTHVCKMSGRAAGLWDELIGFQLALHTKISHRCSAGSTHVPPRAKMDRLRSKLTQQLFLTLDKLQSGVQVCYYSRRILSRMPTSLITFILS